MLLSTLPLIIVLSSLADHRIDDDLSRHIGLNHRGAAIVATLFRTSPAHDAGAIATAIILGIAGTIVAVGLLQETYERVFGLESRGWHDALRYPVWIGALLGALVLESVAAHRLHHAAGALAQALVTLVAVTAFVAWTMHFLLAGRLSYARLARPAFVTGALWIGLATFSAHVFSSTLVSDSRLYGTVGALFTLLTWFVAVASVLVLGAAAGAVWEERWSRRPSGLRRR